MSPPPNAPLIVRESKDVQLVHPKPQIRVSACASRRSFQGAEHAALIAQPVCCPILVLERSPTPHRSNPVHSRTKARSRVFDGLIGNTISGRNSLTVSIAQNRIDSPQAMFLGDFRNDSDVSSGFHLSRDGGAIGLGQHAIGHWKDHVVFDPDMLSVHRAKLANRSAELFGFGQR